MNVFFFTVCLHLIRFAINRKKTVSGIEAGHALFSLPFFLSPLSSPLPPPATAAGRKKKENFRRFLLRKTHFIMHHFERKHWIDGKLRK